MEINNKHNPVEYGKCSKCGHINWLGSEYQHGLENAENTQKMWCGKCVKEYPTFICVEFFTYKQYINTIKEGKQ